MDDLVTASLTEGQLAWRDKVRAVLRGPAVRAELDALRATGDTEPDASSLYAALGRYGILAPDWPERFGGRGLGKVEAMLLAEELVAHGVPDTLHVNSVQIVGGFLLTVADEAQRQRWLPPLAAGTAFASALLSEPGTGSDLGGLATTATRVPGGYRLDGEKRYALKARFAHHALCAARTDPQAAKYQGLSLFYLPLDGPGVTVTALPTIADEQFHAVELDGVRVGEDALVGAPGQGWSLLTRMLVLERTGVDYHSRGRLWYGRLLRHLAGSPVAPDAATLERLGRHGAALSVSRLFTRAVVDGLADGEPDEILAAMAKWYASEAAQAVAWWCAEEAVDGWTDAAYREAPGMTLSAGSSEMMLQLVASARLTSVDGVA